MTVPPVPPVPPGAPTSPGVPRPEPGRPRGPATRRPGPGRRGPGSGGDAGLRGSAGPAERVRRAVTARIDEWRDRVGDRRIQVGVGAAFVAVAALAAGLVWYRIGVGGAVAPTSAVRPTSVAPRSPGDGVPGPTAGGATGRGGALVVHVAGGVAHPGVVALPVGSRVVDALTRAGGPQPDADLDRLNLAAKVLDGQRILVPRLGAPVAGVGGTPDADLPVDLNTATVAQLDTLPGIGPALASAIVAERERRGGFRSVDELGDVRGIGPARLADLRARVAV